MSVATVTISGRLASDPTLRRTESGLAVANLTVAHTPRKQDENGEWQDAGETLWLRVTVWRLLAENVAASLSKGDAVIVSGRLSVRTWKTEAGEPRTDVTCDADTVAADLSRATAIITRFGADAREPLPEQPPLLRRAS